MSFLSNPHLSVKAQKPLIAGDQTPKPEEKKPEEKTQEPAKKAVELV
jgi:hypothetical protein